MFNFFKPAITFLSKTFINYIWETVPTNTIKGSNINNCTTAVQLVKIL